MGVFKVLGALALVPATVLLTISFFVLFAAEKAFNKNIKTFGFVVAILLWICAALVLFGGVFMVSSGRHVVADKLNAIFGCPMKGMMEAPATPKMEMPVMKEVPVKMHGMTDKAPMKDMKAKMMVKPVVKPAAKAKTVKPAVKKPAVKKAETKKIVPKNTSEVPATPTEGPGDLPLE